MNVIIVEKDGILETPFLINNNTTAQATFNNLAEQLLGQDASEVDLLSDNCVNEVNRLLDSYGYKIHWFTDVKTNSYRQT